MFEFLKNAFINVDGVTCVRDYSHVKFIENKYVLK